MIYRLRAPHIASIIDVDEHAKARKMLVCLMAQLVELV